jgi:hypothetical protein
VYALSQLPPELVAADTLKLTPLTVLVTFTVWLCCGWGADN